MKKRIFISLFVCLLTMSFTVPAFAATKVGRSGNRISVSHRPEGTGPIAVGPLLEEIAKAATGIKNKEDITFDLSGLDDGALAKICETYPDMVSLMLNDTGPRVTGFVGITTLEPLGKLTKLTSIDLRTFEKNPPLSTAPLAAATTLDSVFIQDVQNIDLAPLGGIESITDIGLDKPGTNDIGFVAGLSNLATFSVLRFVPKDMAPLAQTPVDSLTLTAVNGLGNLGFLANMPQLKTLHITSTDGLSNWAALNKLVALTDLKLSEVNAKSGDPIDLGFVAAMPELDTLSLSESKVTNFEAMKTAKELVGLRMIKTVGVTSLAPLKALPKLSALSISKGVFPPEDLTGFADKSLAEKGPEQQ